MITRGAFMKSRFTFVAKLLALGLTALCSIGAAGGNSDGSILYDIADLGTLGGPTSNAWSINDRGQIVGWSTLPGAATWHAFLYSEGRMIDLGTLAGGNSEARAVNDSGEVAGSSDGTAFLYHDGAMQDLGTLGGISSTAYGINSARWVVGNSIPTFDTPYADAFLFCVGEMIDLGTLGGIGSTAYGINDAGQVVGFAADLFQQVHAFLYNGQMIDLGPGAASAINRKGQVAGANGLSGHLFLYDGVIHDLGTLIEGFSTGPSSINDAGKIVGTASAGASLLPFLYDGTRIVDLNNLIPTGSRWLLYEARGINNSGQIVGLGNHAGRDRAFLLTPRRQSRE